VRLERAQAKAFGPLRRATLELSRRMTVVYGPNEAGKSTWHAAIHAALCGRRRAARTKVESEFADQYRPWDGGEWAVSAALELADGRRLEVQQNLDDPAASRVTERDTGRDVTGEFLSDGAPDLSRLLGLTRETMLAISTVRQAEITRVREDAGALQVQLEAATSKAGADATAEEAIRRIEAFKREHVGLRRANSTKPLQAAIEARAGAQRALGEARRAHEGYLELVVEREEAEAAAEVARARLEAARRWVRRSRLETERGRLERARALAEGLRGRERPDV
jgi:uncharacterized protein YhaN